MESYIVRIYQRDNERLAGVLETTQGEKRTHVFHDGAELWNILMTCHIEKNRPSETERPTLKTE
jgi:hypothetical protein